MAPSKYIIVVELLVVRSAQEKHFSSQLNLGLITYQGYDPEAQQYGVDT